MDLVPKRFRIANEALENWDEGPAEKAAVAGDINRDKEKKTGFEGKCLWERRPSPPALGGE